MPTIAYGTGKRESEGKDFHKYIELALNAGYCHIDTAQSDFNP